MQEQPDNRLLSAEERVLDAGFEGVVLLVDFSYDDALVGVTTDSRAVYDFDKMVAWLMNTEKMTEEEALDWINYNTIRALGYAGPKAPLVMYLLEEPTQ